MSQSHFHKCFSCTCIHRPSVQRDVPFDWGIEINNYYMYRYACKSDLPIISCAWKPVPKCQSLSSHDTLWWSSAWVFLRYRPTGARLDQNTAANKREVNTSFYSRRGSVLLKTPSLSWGLWTGKVTVSLRLAVHWAGMSKEWAEVCGNPRAEPMRPSMHENGLPPRLQSSI